MYCIIFCIRYNDVKDEKRRKIPMKSRKISTPVSFRLNAKTVEQLEQFCKETGATKTGAVENILRKFLSEYFEKPARERSNFL